MKTCSPCKAFTRPIKGGFIERLDPDPAPFDYALVLLLPGCPLTDQGRTIWLKWRQDIPEPTVPGFYRLTIRDIAVSGRRFLRVDEWIGEYWKNWDNGAGLANYRLLQVEGPFASRRCALAPGPEGWIDPYMGLPMPD